MIISLRFIVSPSFIMLSKSFFRPCLVFVLYMAFLLPLNSWAGIQILGTRVIFNSNKKETSVTLVNSGKRPTLIQAWIEDQQGEAVEDLPFLITPPLLRIDNDQHAVLRILRIGDDVLANDRESLFWFNVKEIPELAKEENVLQFAVTTRLKLFSRPTQLSIKVEDAYRKLQWQVSTKGQQLILTVTNPTPFFITLSSLKVNQQIDIPTTAMVPPFGQSIYTVEKNTLSAAQVTQITYQAINDYGAETEIFEVKPTH